MKKSLPPPRLIYLLNSAQRRLLQWIGLQQTQHAASVGAAAPTAAQSGVLFVLAKEDGATMGQLAKELDLAPSAVSGLIQRMESTGWVLRRACAEDARTQRVWLKAAGQAQLPLVRVAMQRINRQLTAGFTPDELQTVARWLTHVQTLNIDEPTKDRHD
jgi:DNA-binding MarR family transcriptional regulator